MRPDVGGIQRNIDGDIADDQHAVFMGILPQPLPLRMEAELQEPLKIKLVVQQLTVVRHASGWCIRISSGHSVHGRRYNMP